MRFFVSILLILGLCGSEVYLSFLQGVAWTGMVLNYTSEDGLRRGVEKTFSGEAPCPLCTAVKQQRAQQSGDGAVSLPVPAPLLAVLINATRMPFRFRGHEMARVSGLVPMSPETRPPLLPPPRLG